MRIAEDLSIELTMVDWQEGLVRALVYLVSPLDVFLSAVIINKFALAGIIIAGMTGLLRPDVRRAAGRSALGLGIVGTLATILNACLFIITTKYYNPVVHLSGCVEMLYAIGLGSLVWRLLHIGRGDGETAASNAA